MSAQTKLRLTKIPAWKPNGPMDYARSVQKYNIGFSPEHSNLFFTRDNKLFRSLPRTLEEAHHGHPSAIQRVEEGIKGLLGKKSETPAQSSFQYKTVGGNKTMDLKAVSSTGEVDVPAEDVQNDLEYVVEVSLGTPAVTLKLDFDTGSSDLWVFSSQLTLTAAQAAEHTVYDPSASSTAKEVSGESWNISYGDGSSASGSIYTDTVTVGDVTIPDQAVETASKASTSFLSPGSDGLLGLAWPSINTATPKQVLTPVANMIAQNLISQPIFTVKLDRSDDTSSSAGSFYTFGFIDESVALKGSISYIPVDSSNGFWEFPSNSVTIGGKKVSRTTTAIADTGTTLLLLEDSVVKQIYKGIKGATLSKAAGGYVIPTAATLPDIGLEAGGVTYTIPGSDLKFADNGDGTWFGAVQSKGSNPQEIWGDVWLKRMYVVFDQGQTRLGVAERA